jgi:hypothetical protein
MKQAGLANDRKAYDMLRLIVLTCNSEFDTQIMEPWTLKLYERNKQMFPSKALRVSGV